MRMTGMVLLCFVATLADAAARTPEGRWQGPVSIPGRDLQLTLDLAQDKDGTWTGSIIIPGLGIKGVPTANMVMTAAGLAFDVGSPLQTPDDGPARFTAHLTAAGRMAGEWRQGGNVARLDLKRISSARVESPQRSTAVGRDIEDQWIGDFELGGYPRHATITIANRPGAAATAKFLIVGKQKNDLPVDLVVEEDHLLRIESQANHVAFEGRLFKDADELRGIVELGSLELPLVLHRSERKPS